MLRIRIVPEDSGRIRHTRQQWRADFGCGKLSPRSRVLRPEHQATSPLLWVATQLGRFLSDGYREIRALIASNTPHSLKKVFTGSLAALVLALLAVIVIASQLHPAVVILAVACVLDDRLRRKPISKAGTVRRLFPVWFHALHRRWPDHDGSRLKKSIRCLLK